MADSQKYRLTDDERDVLVDALQVAAKSYRLTADETRRVIGDPRLTDRLNIRAAACESLASQARSAGPALRITARY